jgi:glycosidase
MSASLKLIYDSIVSKKREGTEYWIPKLWITSKKVKILEEKNGFAKVEPYRFFSSQIGDILKNCDDKSNYAESLSKINKLEIQNGKVVDNEVNRIPGDWLAGANIYGLYIRNFSAFDHNLDGELGGSKDDITLNADGIKETGTFFKAISVLPYIKSLGFNTIYLLPVSLIGKANRKGELGSPYGLRNPFKIDPVYHDTLIDEFDIDVEFRAFVESAHILGMRVMLDFVPRTASRDSEFIKEHPDWFYWIKRSEDAGYHSPEFSNEELTEIHKRCSGVHGPNTSEMVPPHDNYKAIFTPHPAPEDIVYAGDDTGYIGKVNGEEVVVPGAFADWPPEDIQPPWTDVTYFKLYEDEEFNYVAYNTIRMYDGRIKKANKALWDNIANFIPFFQIEFGIDGARIDMGHALPHKLERMIIERARKEDPDFGFLAEDFNVWARAREKGYNMLMGNSWFTLSRTLVSEPNGDSMAKNFIKLLPDYPNPVLGCPETTDTPRAASRKGGIKFSKAVWCLVNTLPNIVPFCAAGFELGDNHPSNLGLDFTHEEIEVLSKKPLAFFDRAGIAWNSHYAEEMIQIVRDLNRFREENKGNILNLDNFSWVENDVDGNPSMSHKNPVVSFMRRFEENMLTVQTSGIFGEVLFPVGIDKDYLVVANMDCENEAITTLKIKSEMAFFNIFNNEEYKTVDNELNFRLKPGEVVIAVSG